jgi:hypothetical protein
MGELPESYTLPYLLQAFSYTFFFTLYEQSGIVLNGYW